HTRWPRDWSSDVCSSDLSERVRAVLDVDVGDIEERRLHLRADEAVKDQLVEVELLFRQVRLDLVGIEFRRRGADRFVRFLRLHRSEERRVGKEGSCRWAT